MEQLRTPQTGVLEALLRLERSSEAPSRPALERAREIARFIERHQFPIPFVFPTEIGGVQFEWRGGSREVDLEGCLKERRSRFGPWLTESALARARSLTMSNAKCAIY